jgi:hypothetical protein
MTAWEGPEEKEGCVDWLTRIRVSGGGLSSASDVQKRAMKHKILRCDLDASINQDKRYRRLERKKGV